MGALLWHAFTGVVYPNPPSASRFTAATAPVSESGKSRNFVLKMIRCH
jgi:hypothetical protein